MIEYRIVKADNSILPQMWKNNWQLIQILDNKMYFSKQVKQEYNATIWDKNKEWLEFRTKYKEIKDSWLSSNALIVKYNKLTKEWLHTSIMNNLDDYAKHLEAHKKKEYWLMAQTYINQERYRDNWEVVKVDFWKKWINDLLKERWFTIEVCDNIIGEVNAWEVKQKNEMTSWVLENIIKYVLW